MSLNILLTLPGTRRSHLHPGTLYFACLRDTLEDYTNTEYLRDCAMQAGIATAFLFIDGIGWDEERQVFVDNECRIRRSCFCCGSCSRGILICCLRFFPAMGW